MRCAFNSLYSASATSYQAFNRDKREQGLKDLAKYHWKREHEGK